MKRKMKILMSLIIGIFIVAPIVVYAAFTYSTRYKTNIIVGEVENATLTAPKIDLEVTFAAPGDSKEYTYSVVNSDAKAYSYNYDIVLLDSNNNEITTYSKLLDMIYVYFDEEYKGVLKDFVINDVSLFNDLFLLPSKTRNNKFKFELHNGALGLTLDQNTIRLRIDCNLQTTNVQQYIYVGTNEEFVKAVSDVNRVANKTIVLTKNLTVTTPVTIRKDATIDVCGNTLTLNANINVENSILNIIDNMNNGTVAGNNNFILNDENSFVNPLMNVTNVVINNYNEAMLVSVVKEKITNIKSIDSSIQNDLIGNYDVYLSKLGFSISSTKMTITNGVTAIINLEYNQVLDITISTENLEELVELKIIGSENVNSVITSNLAHLNGFESKTNSIQVIYDLFLPTKIEAVNATISWYSSDASIMSNDGKIQKETGYITLTATIKVHDDVYTKDYYIYVVHQDNQSKLQYLATQVERGTTEMVGLNFTEIGQSFKLPTTIENEDDNYYYTQWTDGKNLGIEELDYELESSYIYLTLNESIVDKTGGTLIPGKLLSTADITLTKVTYSKAARLKIIGYFENGERVETYIAISISLNAESLQAQVFKDAQTILDSVDVLQNVLDTRTTNGILNESGNFTLPNMINSVDIKFIQTEGETCYTVEENEEGFLIKIDLTKVELTDLPVYITCAIVTHDENGNEILIPNKNLTFNVPGALTPSNFKFVEVVENENVISYPFDFTNSNAKAIFYSLKVQALQSDPNTLFDQTRLLKVITNSSELYSLAPYILMYDIGQTEVLKFENGDSNTVIDYYDLTVYNTLISWATGNTISTVPTEIEPFLEQGLLWIKSDGQETLSDGEIRMIVAYCERYPGFSNYWADAINVLDNILSESDEALLLESLITDKNFVQILEWLRSNESKTLYEFINPANMTEEEFATSLNIPIDALNAYSDGLESISNDEERVIIYYVQANHWDVYDEFYNIWSTAVIRKNNNSAVVKDILTENIITYYTKKDAYSSVSCYDPLFSALLEWMLYSADSENGQTSLNDFITAKKISGLESIFDNQLEYENSWLYASNSLLGGSNYADVINNNEWNAMVYLLSLYGINKVNVTINSVSHEVTFEQDFIENTLTEENVGDYPYMAYRGISSGFLGGNDSGPCMTSEFINAIVVEVNKLYTQNSVGTNYKKIINWANSTTYTRITPFTDLFASNPLTIVNGNRISDNSLNIYYDEYLVLYAYLLEVIFKDINENLRNLLISYNLPLDLSFQNNTITDSQYSNMLYIINPQEGFKEIIDKISYECITGLPTITDDCDNLETISKTELEALVNTFKDNDEFISQLQNAISSYTLSLVDGVYVATKVETNLDRELSSTDQTSLENSIKEILGTNVDSTQKFVYIPLETVSEDVFKTFYALRHFTNLKDLAFLGTSTTFLFDSSNTANKIFDVVANVTESLERITFNYTGLSNIGLITNMINLEFIDLRFNYSVGDYKGINDINPILTLQENKKMLNKNSITYLTTFKTDLNFLYGEVVYAKIYNINNEAKLYYEQEGEEVLYEPGSLNANQQTAINACALLHEIETIEGPYLILPTKVYLDATGNDVVWNLVVANSLVTFINNKIVVNDLGNKGDIIVSATVTVGEESYTRYFNITIVYSIANE